MGKEKYAIIYVGGEKTVISLQKTDVLAQVKFKPCPDNYAGFVPRSSKLPEVTFSPIGPDQIRKIESEDAPDDLGATARPEIGSQSPQRK